MGALVRNAWRIIGLFLVAARIVRGTRRAPPEPWSASLHHDALRLLRSVVRNQ
jgi:hypothetical protein